MGDNEDTTDPGYIVEIGSHRFDPKDEGPKGRLEVTAGRRRLANALGVEIAEVPGAGRDVWVVQFAEDPQPTTVGQFRDRYGLQLTQRISPLAFIEPMSGTTAAKVRREPAVRACVLLPPHFKAHDFASVSDLSPDPVVQVGLVNAADSERMAHYLGSIGLTILSVQDARDLGGVITMNIGGLTDELLAALVVLDDVLWVKRLPTVGINNLDAAGVAQGGEATTHTVWAQSIHGEDMVIGVMDPGVIDMQSRFFSDARQPNPGANHRKVVELRSFGSAKFHATMVAGCAVADEDGKTGRHANRGGAWAAKLVYGDINRCFGISPPSNFLAELASAAAAGAYIHSNSWGLEQETEPNEPGLPAPPYDQTAMDADTFTWYNEDHLLLASGGNSTDKSHNGGIVLSKNAIAVIACKKAEQQHQFFDGKANLTADGRRKPDLVCVGENVASSDLTDKADPQHLKHHHVVGAAPGGPLAVAIAGGTSLATPHVAAAATLVRQYFIEGWYPNGKKEGARREVTPSGALLKAMLLNATVDLEGVPDYPSVREGWGRLQLDKTLHFDGDKVYLRVKDVPHIWGFETCAKTYIFRLDVPENAKSMKITLVFNDPAGEVGATDPVVNKLDLLVMEPMRSRWKASEHGYFGNDFSNKVSRRKSLQSEETGFPPTPDDLKNNVRQVVVETPVSGLWGLAVSCKKFDKEHTPKEKRKGRKAQGFALVARVELS